MYATMECLMERIEQNNDVLIYCVSSRIKYYSL